MNQLQTAIFDELQTFQTSFLVALANQTVDSQAIAKAQLANQGLDLQGKWIGFDESKKLMQQTTVKDLAIQKIARDFLGLDTLQACNSDSQDFKEQSVWQIEAALKAAFEAGKQS